MDTMDEEIEGEFQMMVELDSTNINSENSISVKDLDKKATIPNPTPSLSNKPVLKSVETKPKASTKSTPAKKTNTKANNSKTNTNKSTNTKATTSKSATNKSSNSKSTTSKSTTVKTATTKATSTKTAASKATAPKVSTNATDNLDDIEDDFLANSIEPSNKINSPSIVKSSSNNSQIANVTSSGTSQSKSGSAQKGKSKSINNNASSKVTSKEGESSIQSNSLKNETLVNGNTNNQAIAVSSSIENTASNNSILNRVALNNEKSTSSVLSNKIKTPVSDRLNAFGFSNNDIDDINDTSSKINQIIRVSIPCYVNQPYLDNDQFNAIPDLAELIAINQDNILENDDEEVDDEDDDDDDDDDEEGDDDDGDDEEEGDEDEEIDEDTEIDAGLSDSNIRPKSLRNKDKYLSSTDLDEEDELETDFILTQGDIPAQLPDIKHDNLLNTLNVAGIRKQDISNKKAVPKRKRKQIEEEFSDDDFIDDSDLLAVYDGTEENVEDVEQERMPDFFVWSGELTKYLELQPELNPETIAA